MIISSCSSPFFLKKIYFLFSVLLELGREPDLLLSGEALQGLELAVQGLDLLAHAAYVLLSGRV